MDSYRLAKRPCSSSPTRRRRPGRPGSRWPPRHRARRLSSIFQGVRRHRLGQPRPVWPPHQDDPLRGGRQPGVPERRQKTADGGCPHRSTTTELFNDENPNGGIRRVSTCSLVPPPVGTRTRPNRHRILLSYLFDYQLGFRSRARCPEGHTLYRRQDIERP